VAKYPIAVVAASKYASAAQEFVDFLLTPAAQDLLKQAGFGAPPSS
jgi:ABC-type molybdate transport system substrate-binding protein